MQEVRAAVLSCAGSRSHNEDCAAIDSHRAREGVLETFILQGTRHVGVVADGMGGHASGELASQLAISGLLVRAETLSAPHLCISAIQEINREIYDAMFEDQKFVGMGTTIAGVILTRDHTLWFNVGDSRIYLVRKGAIKQLSVDHVPHTGAEKRRTHAITQSLGGGGRYMEVWPSVGSIRRQVGDLLLLCTDGLTDTLDDRQILETCMPARSPEEAIGALVSTALTEGAADNVTALALQL